MNKKAKLLAVIMMISFSIPSFALFGGKGGKGMTKVLTQILTETQKIQKDQAKGLTEDIRQTLEAIEQTEKQIAMVQNDMTNLQSWGGLILGEENSYLIQTFDDLNAINKQSQSILRNAKTIEDNFDKVYLTRDKLTSMDSKELANELYRIGKYKNNNLKEHLKTASLVLEQNEKEAKKMGSFMAATDNAKGNLQASLATKKGVDQLNTKIARLTDVQAKAIIIQAEKMAEEEAVEQLLDEQVKRMTQMNPATEKKANQMLSSGKLW